MPVRDHPQEYKDRMKKILPDSYRDCLSCKREDVYFVEPDSPECFRCRLDRHMKKVRSRGRTK